MLGLKGWLGKLGQSRWNFIHNQVSSRSIISQFRHDWMIWLQNKNDILTYELDSCFSWWKEEMSSISCKLGLIPDVLTNDFFTTQPVGCLFYCHFQHLRFYDSAKLCSQRQVNLVSNIPWTVPDAPTLSWTLIPNVDGTLLRKFAW